MDRIVIYRGADVIRFEDDSKCVEGYYFIGTSFELIEEQQDIDIQAIEEINITSYKGFVETCRYIEKKGNEIIQAIKQLDNKIRKE